MKSNLGDILENNANDISSTIFEIMNYLNETTNYGKHMNKLNEYEKTAYYVFELEGEVNNGGFSQYFFNSSGKNVNPTIKSLENIGAVQTAQLLIKAKSVNDGGIIEFVRKKFRMDTSEKQEDKLDKLDQIFYQYEEQISDLTLKYIQKSIQNTNEK